MNTMKLFISSLMCLFTFQVAGLAADTQGLPVCVNTIHEINLNYDNSLLTGTIALDSGAILRIVDYKQRDDNILKSWQAGDRVLFSPKTQDEELFLLVKNIQGDGKELVEPYVIFDILVSPKTGMMIEEVQDGGKFIKLNNNSVWEFGFINRFTTKHWEPGQRVLVSGAGEKNEYSFINLDCKPSLKAYEANGSFVVN